MKNQKGFTLVELIIVIVILAILTIVTVPFYQYHVEKAKITEALSMLKTIADANVAYYLEHNTWCSDIRDLDIEIGGVETTLDGMVRIETENFIYACAGDKSTSKTIATVNRKPFKKRYWFSFAATPSKEKPQLGKYTVTGDATYADSQVIDKMLVKHYLDKYNK